MASQGDMLRNTMVVIQFFHMMRIALGVFAALLLGLIPKSAISDSVGIHKTVIF